MNIERFAGDNRIFQTMAEMVKRNEQLMKARHDDSQRIMARQKQRDIAAAYGQTIPFTAADFPSV